MRPKKLLGLVSNRGKLQGRQTTLLSRFADSDSDSESNNETSPQVRLSQTILGAHNTLKQLLSGPNALDPATPLKKRGRKPKSATVTADSPVLASATPLSRLKSAAALLASPLSGKRSSIHFDDIEAVVAPKRKRGRPPKPKPIESTQIIAPPRQKRKYTRRQPKKESEPDQRTNERYPNGTSNERANERSATGLSSRATRTVADGTASFSKFNSGLISDHSENDDYVEQVSHHELDLAEEPRRSSYSNRGKRVLSIGNGYVAKPHAEVSASEYYKLLDTAMPEPSQVRQLLVWCLRKKLEKDQEDEEGSSGKTVSESETARGIAKIIKREILDDLVDGAISTSWYSQKGKPEPLASKRIVRPNPLNESNRENIEIFTRKLRQLQAEKKEWHASYDACVAPLASLNIEKGTDEAALQRHVAGTNRRMADDVVAGHLLGQMQADAGKVKEYVPQRLEESVDRLFHMLYQMEQTVKLVAKVEKERLQSQVAQVVERFMERGQAGASSKDLLRGISRLDAPRKTKGR